MKKIFFILFLIPITAIFLFFAFLEETKAQTFTNENDTWIYQKDGQIYHIYYSNFDYLDETNIHYRNLLSCLPKDRKNIIFGYPTEGRTDAQSLLAYSFTDVNTAYVSEYNSDSLKLLLYPSVTSSTSIVSYANDTCSNDIILTGGKLLDPIDIVGSKMSFPLKILYSNFDIKNVSNNIVFNYLKKIDLVTEETTGYVDVVSIDGYFDDFHRIKNTFTFNGAINKNFAIYYTLSENSKENNAFLKFSKGLYFTKDKDKYYELNLMVKEDGVWKNYLKNIYHLPISTSVFAAWHNQYEPGTEFALYFTLFESWPSILDSKFKTNYYVQFQVPVLQSIVFDLDLDTQREFDFAENIGPGSGIGTDDSWYDDLTWYEWLNPINWFRFLIEPAQGYSYYFDEKITHSQEVYDSKMVAVNQSKEIISSITSYRPDENGQAPHLTINYPKFGLVNAKVVDFSFYDTYRSNVHFAILCYGYARLCIWVIRKFAEGGYV